MTGYELMRSLNLDPHVEGGTFRELYRDGHHSDQRMDSGVIYYALDKDEDADFHVLDSDEYWLYHAGTPLELWMIGIDGVISRTLLGIEKGCQPCVLIPKGVTFGARHLPGADDATVVSCVTVPEFSYEHYILYTKEQVLQRWPDVSDFWRKEC